MRDDKRVTAGGRRAFSWRSHLLGTLAWLLAAALIAPVSAQRPDDSYKGPATGGGLDGQRRQFDAPPPAPNGGGGGLVGGGGAGALQGRQTQGTIAPIPIAIPIFLGPDPRLSAAIADV